MLSIDWLNIVWWQWALIGSLLAVFLFQLFFYARYMAGVLRRVRRDKKGMTPHRTDQPGISVIVCARNEAYNLNAYLPHLLEQDYPRFEVIVVDDGSQDDTHNLLEQWQLRYKNLRTTFVPQQARVKSTKKLALTLAVKAAQYDYLVLTDADCTPESNQWLSHLMMHFTGETDIILGFGAYFGEKGFLNRVIAYDTLFNGLQYLGMAVAGHPYMGVGRNLAYKKEVFLNNRGFAGTLSERAGDDDLFINKVATGKNTDIAVTRESVTWSVPKRTLRTWLQQKERHLGVAPHYRTATKTILTFEPLTRALFYGLIIAIGIVGLPVFRIAAAVLFIIRLAWQAGILNKAARHFGTRCFSWEILLFDIWLPLNTLALMLHYSVIGKYRQRW